VYNQDFKRNPVAEHTQPIHNRILVPLRASPPALQIPSPEPSTSTPKTKTPSTISSSSTSEKIIEYRDLNPTHASYTAHGLFSGEVAAAIDDRAGLVPAATSHLVPLVDAPLFGELDLETPYSPHSSTAELPPRACADTLVDIYWQYVHPVEPILDRDRFFREYTASYSNPDVLYHADREIWFSILNVVFALAIQRREFTALQKRNEEGNIYFHHAWANLRPETILWKPGSLELVQCLMLMNRYLHCTNNQQKKWMTARLGDAFPGHSAGHQLFR
jgi:hypothetical protein